MYNIARNARRAALFFLFCLLTALVGLPIRGALAAHAVPVVETVRIEQRAAAAPASVEAARNGSGQIRPGAEMYCGR